MKPEIQVQAEPIIHTLVMSQRVAETRDMLESITVESPPASQEEGEAPSAESSFSENSKEDYHAMESESEEHSLDDEGDLLTGSGN